MMYHRYLLDLIILVLAYVGRACVPGETDSCVVESASNPIGLHIQFAHIGVATSRCGLRIALNARLSVCWSVALGFAKH